MPQVSPETMSHDCVVGILEKWDALHSTLQAQPGPGFLQRHGVGLPGASVEEFHQNAVVARQFDFPIKVVNLSQNELVAFGRLQNDVLPESPLQTGLYALGAARTFDRLHNWTSSPPMYRRLPLLALAVRTEILQRL